MVRKITRAITTTAAAIALLCGAAHAADNLAAQSDFFREGMSARTYGMGNAFVGVCDDVTALYWNPAGLGTLTAPQAMTTKTSLDFFESNIQGFSVAVPYGRGVWALNYVYSNTDVPLFGPNPSNPLRFDYPLGIQSERYTGLALGYGMKWRPNLYLGLAIKSMKFNLFGHTANGTGIDAGALLTDKGGNRVGVNLQNIGGVRMGVMDEVPFNIQMGASRKFAADKLLLAVAYDSNYLGDSGFSVGAEYKVAQHFTARLGTRGEDKLAYGLSVDIENFRLDYALNSGSDEDETGKLSIAYFVSPKQPKPAPAPAKAAEKPKEEKPAVAEKPKEEKPKPEKKEKPKEEKPKKETKPKEEKAKKEEKPKKEETAKKEEPKKETPTTTVIEPPRIDENAKQPAIKLPSVADLLGETGTNSSRPPAPYIPVSPQPEPNYSRFPAQEGEFGMSNEYDGKIP